MPNRAGLPALAKQFAKLTTAQRAAAEQLVRDGLDRRPVVVYEPDRGGTRDLQLFLDRVVWAALAAATIDVSRDLPGVAACVLRRAVTEVSIVPHGGIASVTPIKPNQVKRRERELIITYAGIAAERRYNADVHDRRVHDRRATNDDFNLQTPVA